MALLNAHLFSQTLWKNVSLNLILPEAVEGPYHVLFLLHGLSDDYTKWTRMTSLERYVEGLPLLVVMPDGGRNFYLDGVQSARYGTHIGEELPEVISRWFPVHAGFAISGLSMGGYGALRLAFVHPQRFASAYALSGAVEFGQGGDYVPIQAHPGEYERMLGEEREGGFADLFALAKQSGGHPAFGFECGTEDYLIDSNRRFHRHLRELGIEHEYHEHPGQHDWTYWDQHVQDAIAFHRRVLKF